MGGPDAHPAFASDPLWQRAQHFLVRGQFAAARQVLASLQSAGRGSGVHAYLLAAQLALFDDRVRDAARLALGAASIAPGDVEALCAVAGVSLETGETRAARECLDRAAFERCDQPLPWMHGAALRTRLHQHPEALALLDQAASRGGTSPGFRYMRGESLVANGRLDEAESEFAAVLAVAPGHGRAAVSLVRLRRQTPERNFLPAIEVGVRSAPPGSGEQAAFEFARYKTLADLGLFDAAWRALARGNTLMRARLPDTFARFHASLERMLGMGLPAGRSSATAAADGPAPIFIIGMPRSGTTLLERMLGNHPQVRLAGELNDFGAQLRWAADTRDLQTDAAMARVRELDFAALGRRYLAQTRWYGNGAAFYVDKQPTNWLLAAAIHAALPNAPILHMVRDPMDTCFSNWRTWFGAAWAYSYDLAMLAAYFNDYRRVMAHWHASMPGAILDVSYPELVGGPEATLRKVFDFCGLAWEPGCADIRRNTAPTGTVSAVQVRGPLLPDTGGQWRRHAARLAPLVDALADAGGAPS